MFKVFNLTMSLLYQVHSWYKNFQNDKNTFISSINHAGLIFLNKSTFTIFILNTVTPWINHMVLLILSLSLHTVCQYIQIHSWKQTAKLEILPSHFKNYSFGQ